MAQRPLTATVSVFGPFKVLTRPLTLPPKDSKAPSSGGPVAWWKLDETTGAEAADASGNRHPARVQGTARWTSQGRLGGAFELDDAGNFVDCGDATNFDFRDGLTVSLWVKPGQSEKSLKSLIAKGSDTWGIASDGNTGGVAFHLAGPQTTGKDKKRQTRVTAKRSLNDGQWHHLAAVYDGQRMALFVDGELADSVTASGPLAINTEPVLLGENSASRKERFVGAVDDVRLYNRGLSESEIKALKGGSAK